MSYSTVSAPSVKIETLKIGDKFVKSRHGNPMLMIHTFKSVSFGLAYSVHKSVLLLKREVLVKRVLAIDILTPFTEWS